MFSDKSMTFDLFKSEVCRLPIAGYSEEGIKRLWKWYSSEVQHDVLFNAQCIACDWIEYPTVYEAVKDLNRNYIRDLVRNVNGSRLNEMDLRVLGDDILLQLLKRKIHALELENGGVLVDISD